ncbi:alpha/beta fold hydrolase [Herbidospora mongoliensis]|uniref:alpha/beta fold hydrolase n=1 Tax=Herbidospora mongoliensis TaxID=688067 RepID=UPI0008329405|nr:alpha/beta hydrolase [Herbidospora mongoliensis]
MIATLHDGAEIEIEAHGDGPALLLPVNAKPAEDGPAAEAMWAWGGEPDLGFNLVNGLKGQFRVIAFDYEGHCLAVPKRDLTPENVVNDFLAVADAAQVESFAYYGYSWLAMVGLQLAIRSDRLKNLVMGGYPPIYGPYREMLVVTETAWEYARNPEPPAENLTPGDWDSATPSANPEQVGQFMVLYQELQEFDDRAVVLDIPSLCFAGSDDAIVYGDKWGGVTVDIAGPLLRNRDEIVAKGWEVRVLDGLDHMSAMRSEVVLPILTGWVGPQG